MCGIVGFTGSPDTQILRNMCDALYHRGPDDDGYYEDSCISLAMRRLAIVDIESGQQPVFNETGEIWVIFNGEIYNHLELRNSLLRSGHIFKTSHSDTEVIVHLYEEYGEEWATHVNGMFGVAIWDKRTEQLLLYRDRIGKKPLYYSTINGKIIFASEIKSLHAHPDISRDFNYQALYHYFKLKNISAPSTAYSEINQLLPGHFIRWQRGASSIIPYWRPNFNETLNGISEEEASDHLFQLFEDAVKIRMQCDAPYGAYLSGGVDSSAVVAMMCKHQVKPVKTFCLGYEDHSEGQFWGKDQDIEYARKMSKILGTEHYEYIIDAKQFAEQMANIISAFDEPFSGTVSTYFLSILIKNHVKVALSGDGADELFGSYLAHRLAFPIENYLNLRQNGIRHWEDLSESDKVLIHPFDTPSQFRFLQSVAASDISIWRGRLGVFSNDDLLKLLSAEFLHASGSVDNDDIYDKLKSNLTATDILNKSLEIDQNELLPNQVLPFVDRLSMAHSIEVRVPYLDYRIIEFANRLPGNFKIKNGIVKYIHKQTMRGLLPDDLLMRPKEGFVQPIYSWMHDSLKDWVYQYLEVLPQDLFNSDYINLLKKKFADGDQSINAKIWNLICFSLWFEGVVGS